MSHEIPHNQDESSMSINKSPKLSAKRTETDKKRSAFAKKGAATATGALNKPLGSNPKATIGFDAGQQAVLDKMLAEEAAEKVYVTPKWKVRKNCQSICCINVYIYHMLLSVLD